MTRHAALEVVCDVSRDVVSERIEQIGACGLSISGALFRRMMDEWLAVPKVTRFEVPGTVSEGEVQELLRTLTFPQFLSLLARNSRFRKRTRHVVYHTTYSAKFSGVVAFLIRLDPPRCFGAGIPDSPVAENDFPEPVDLPSGTVAVSGAGLSRILAGLFGRSPRLPNATPGEPGSGDDEMSAEARFIRWLLQHGYEHSDDDVADDSERPRTHFIQVRPIAPPG